MSGVLCVAALAWPGSSARAAKGYDNCSGFIDALPATINTQGVWCLRKNLSTSITSGHAINILANNVTIDCNNFKVGGLAGGPGTVASGIHAEGRHNITIRHCNIRGFGSGIVLAGGGGHFVENNTVDNSTLAGISVAGEGTMVRRNQVRDIGGAVTPAGAVVGISVGDDVDVIDNAVSGVAANPAAVNANAYGIQVVGVGDGSINDNRVRGLAPVGEGFAVGILVEGNGRTTIRDNHLMGTADPGSVAVLCGGTRNTARDNIMGGFLTGVSGCLADGNTFNGF
jgi:parallel beta-helix repeat protein